MTDLQKAAKWLTENDDYAILMHASPDGDAIGSGYGLRKMLRALGKRAACFCADPIPRQYDLLMDGEKDDFAPRHVVAVDLADAKLLGALEAEWGSRIELCIDHHVSNRVDCDILVLDGAASAASEILYDLAGALGVAVDEGIAACLYTGIATDTGCFKYTNTSAKTHETAARLIEAGAPYGDINRVMFDIKSRARLEVERLALESMEYHFDDRCALIVVTEEMESMTTPGDLEGITALTRQVEGVLVGLTFRYKGPDRYKVSARSVEPVDASAICASLGGGGHLRAAGCELRLPLAEAKAAMLAAVKRELDKSCRG
ncbi:MAG: bifunctional oligoribonuclease/PAP phosphatase NrnA [Clostridia bacterium]|nr:bifunctional oligoribonuclease/PAP phosphatase NrnA [Clostridia bacterium]